ncbi:AglZ/HisF2 family acetamidino modification protein [Leptospira noguchii]|uniref:imidazole glycerol-phosphate synthase n=1 Tax=Leptospira noguchii TaxID=28182 RepID=M6V9M7_9LEPT|nr:AglZ/HisF2 family acetamidino modification protein [Leptospira noguchii]EMO53555.1 putative imidazoleglycerol phosphate synthase, cyclase subunit [Leptospira noguchii]
MLLPRIIPILLLSGKGLVKGVKFKDHKYVGDPINAVQIFNTKEVDELIFLDILATKERRIPSLEIVQTIADQCLMPFGVGGGISSLKDVGKILKAGAEKVSINTSVLENFSLIKEISDTFGSQSLVVSLDVKKNWVGTYHVLTRCGTQSLSGSVTDIAKKVEEFGAGEILLNNIDKDGTMEGYDLEILSEICRSVSIPVIANGGVGSYEHLKEGLDCGASAVAAGSFFVFHGRRRAVLISYPDPEQKEIILN